MENKQIQKNIPTGWFLKSLGDVLDKVEGGGTPSKDRADFWNGKIPWASVKDIVTQNQNDTIDHISEVGLKNSSSRVVSKGTLIVPTRMALGHAVFFNVDVAINQDLKALYPKKELNNKYLFYWFKSKKEFIQRLGSGSTVSGIQQNELKAIKFLLPPTTEQDKIVNVLEIWDGAIERLGVKIEIKKRVKKGLMRGLLTGKTRLTGFGGEWKATKLGNVATISRGGSPRPIESYITDSKDGLNWLRIGDVDLGAKYIFKTSQKIKQEGLYKTTLVNEGDFILSNSMSYGRPYIMKTSACIHDGWLALMKIKTELVSKNYLYYLLSSEEIQNIFLSISAGSGVQNLKKETVTNISVNLPTTKEQNAIAQILTAADDEIEGLERKLGILKRQKKFLLNNLVTGSIRVPEGV
jgi:type I restriction enzyme S subunit